MGTPEKKKRRSPSSTCAICDSEISETLARYPHAVCKTCDRRAVNQDGKHPWTKSHFDEGENPVIIDGIKCWRRYRFGGWITMRDMNDCRSLGEFYQSTLLGSTTMPKLLTGYQRFVQAKTREGTTLKAAAALWKTEEGFKWLVANVPEDIISAFLDWYSTDAKHVERRENLFRDVITRKSLETLSDEEFAEVIFNFASKGGGVQTGGFRTAGLLRETIEADVDGFRRFLLEPFEPDCDVLDWLGRSKDLKYFGKGTATIYLCWVDKSRYAILNNKTRAALKALGFSIPAKFLERYQAVHRIQSALIQRFPALEDFKKVDYLNHFLVATDEGQTLLNDHFGGGEEQGPDQAIGFKIALSSPNPKAVFTATSFDLLAELLAAPRKDTYLGKKGEYQKHVIDPFQSFFKAAIAKLPPAVVERVETERGVFSRILKNDYGRGGAWPYYWGALFPKGGVRSKDAQIYATIFPDTLRIGFTFGDYSSPQRDQFLQRCRENRAELFSLLNSHFKSTQLYFGDREDSDGPEKESHSIDQKRSFKEWLNDPSADGVNVFFQLPPEKVISQSSDELAELTADIWSSIFPLFLLATEEIPLPAIRNYLGIEEPELHTQPEYPLEQIAEDTGFDLVEIKRWVSATQRKGQAVLYGPPGTGKTFVARKLAKHLVGGGDGFVEFVQFHPAYAYEDFMQGIRPKTKDGALEYFLEPGRFLIFCKEAQNRKGTCVLIIDEINRTNLSRVFGELMYLLEYRNESIPLAGGNRLKIPHNVRLIGTMNTADRSIALVDHALRRRFAFIGLYPKYEVLERFHVDKGYNPRGLIDLLQNINRQIGDPQYEIGISFFLIDDLPDHLEDIWRMEIEPYLEEYFFDKPEKVNEFRWDRIREKVKESV